MTLRKTAEEDRHLINFSGLRTTNDIIIMDVRRRNSCLVTPWNEWVNCLIIRVSVTPLGAGNVVGGEGWNHYHKMIELTIRSRVSKAKVTKYKCSNCLKQCLFLSVVDMHVSCPVMLLAKDMIKTQSANFLATDIVIMLFHSVIGVLLVSKVLFTINLYLDC